MAGEFLAHFALSQPPQTQRRTRLNSTMLAEVLIVNSQFFSAVQRLPSALCGNSLSTSEGQIEALLLRSRPLQEPRTDSA